MRVLALVCLAVFAAVSVHAEDVVVLTTANFDEVTKNTEYVLVEFFAPWCGHCKQLAPEYEKAATALKEYSNLKLASVDATVEQSLATSFGVKGYPTLKFFKNGVASDYTGGRTAPKISSWLLKAIGAPLKVLTSAEAVTTFNSGKAATVIGFFAQDSADFEAFNKASAAESETAFAVVHDPAVAASVGANIPSVVVYKPGDENAVFVGPFTEEAISKFVGIERVPLVIPFTMEAAQEIFQSKVGAIAFLFSATPMPEFAQLAKVYRGKFVFSTTDGSVTRLNDHVGVSADALPAFIIITTDKQMKRYPLEGPVHSNTIQAHIDAFLDGSLAPVLKSEPVPEKNDAPVKIVVGTTFDDIVMDPTKNVLFEVYAPWCGHCKTLAPIYDELAAAVADVPNLVIAKMDGTANEVDGVSWRSFPTLKFYPAGANKDRAGIDYTGGRDLAALQEYVLAQAAQDGNAAAAAKEEL